MLCQLSYSHRNLVIIAIAIQGWQNENCRVRDSGGIVVRFHLNEWASGFVTNPGKNRGRPYSDVWNSIFSSTESRAGVPELSSLERVATTRKPLELVWTS